MSEQEEEYTTQDAQIIAPTGGDIIMQQEAALIDKQVATAKAYPRNITRAIDNSIAIVTMDNETAEKCTYALKRSGKVISGPSVHLARIIAQNWGNMRAEKRVVDISATQVTSEAMCWDLESNLAIKTQVKRSIVGNKGRYSNDMITVTGNAANSIAFRNAIFDVIPKGVVTRIQNAAKKKLIGELSDEDKLITKRKQVFDKYKDSYGLTEKEVLSAIGKAALEHVTAEDILTLVGIGRAIKDGETTVDESFRGKSGGGNEHKEPESKITLEELKNHHDALKALYEPNVPALGAKVNDKAKKVIANGQRIIDGNETANFDKLAGEIRQVSEEITTSVNEANKQ